MPEPPADPYLVVALTAAALERAAPEELLVLEETAEDYFADPAGSVDPKRRDEAVGFGAEFDMIAPYLLAVGTPVVQFLWQAVSSAAQDASRPALVQGVRKLLRLPGEQAPPGPGLSAAQVQQVRKIAYDHARGLELSEEKSALLADSIAGGVIGPP